jgi:hypothetical protein
MDSIFIPENTLIESDLVVNTTVSCYDSIDGVASISSFGGASSVYTYFWSQGQTTLGVNTDFADSLLQGSYYVTTRDILGCEVLDSIYISQPEPLSMEALELDWIDCYGADDGEAFATATGGTAPYVFSWDNGTWLGDTVSTLTPGLHTVVVTDARGCTATDTIFTHEPPLLYIDIDDTQTVLPYCLGVNTASLTAIAGGGTPGYSYEWNDNPVQPQTTTTATALLAGTYVITVMDDKGCLATDTAAIGNTNTMQISVSSLITYVGGNDVSCYGEDDGQALVIASGGHGPYTYQWYGPSSYTSINDTISNLLSGVYSVTVRDTNDCMLNTSIVITEPSEIFFTTLSASDESCLGACDGDVQVDVTGGISPYIAIAAETTTGNIITSQMGTSNTSLVTGICSGTYTFSFTDQNDCPSSLITGGVSEQSLSTNNVTIAEINTANIPVILCNGDATGSLEVLNPNTNAGYTYSWQDLSGNVVSNTTVASNLLAGTYVLHADYNNISGCTTTDTAVVTELDIINPSAIITNVDCFGNSTGLLQGSFQGGTSPHTMLWNPGGILGSTANNLQAGIYTLTVTDINSCQQTDTFEVTQPQSLSASVTQNGFILTVSTPSGGTSPYSYLWLDQSVPLSPPVTSLNYVVSSYGTYSVQVTDANGCEFVTNSIVYEQGPLGVTDLGVVDLQVYPNPFRQETTIDFGKEVAQVEIMIVDVYGKLIEQHDVSDINRYIIKRGDKASGVYFMHVKINNKYLDNIKLVIE